jgi:uncharacterized protein (UPF0303 family)
VGGGCDYAHVEYVTTRIYATDGGAFVVQQKVNGTCACVQVPCAHRR